MLDKVLVAATGQDGGVSLIDVGSRRVLDRLALPHASFLLAGAMDGTYYALHGDDRTGHLTRVMLRDGRLYAEEMVSTEGAQPCHAAFLPDGSLAVACYSGSCVSVFAVSDQGAVKAGPSVIELHGDGPDRSRQEAAHPHFVAADVGGHDALVIDLGSDAVWGIDREGDWRVRRFASVHPGAGPRHGIILADVLLITDELSARLSMVPLTGGREAHSVAATGILGDEPAYPGDLCAVGGRVAVAVRGRRSVSLIDVASRPQLIAETVIPGSWPQQLHAVADHVIVVDRDGGQLVDLDPIDGSWQTLVDGLGEPMWIVPVGAHANA